MVIKKELKLLVFSILPIPLLPYFPNSLIPYFLGGNNGLVL